MSNADAHLDIPVFISSWIIFADLDQVHSAFQHIRIVYLFVSEHILQAFMMLPFFLPVIDHKCDAGDQPIFFLDPGYGFKRIFKIPGFPVVSF